MPTKSQTFVQQGQHKVRLAKQHVNIVPLEGSLLKPRALPVRLVQEVTCAMRPMHNHYRAVLVLTRHCRMQHPVMNALQVDIKLKMVPAIVRYAQKATNVQRRIFHQ